MKAGQERIYKGESLVIYHQNIPKKQLSTHHHDEAHLFIPMAGSIELMIDKTFYPVPVGQMMFVPGSVPHSFSADGQTGERMVIQFTVKSLGHKSIKRPVILPLHPLVRNLLLELFPYAQMPFAKSLESLIHEVLADAISQQGVTAQNALFVTKEKILASRDEIFRKLCQLMQKNSERELESLAQEVGVSLRTLTRLVKNEADLSPKELYTYYRMERACELIYQRKLGLTAIAYECGYSSLSQFITNFKKWTGQKPSQFFTSQQER